MEGQNPMRWLSEGVIVAVTPLMAYLFVYTYEASFSGVFEIPLQFISLDLRSVFVVGSGLIMIYIMLVGFSIGLTPLAFLTPCPHPICRKAIHRLFLVILPFAAFYIFYLHLPWKEFAYGLTLVTILCGLDIFVPFLMSRFPFVPKEWKGNWQKDTILDYIARLIGKTGLVVALCLSVGLYVSYTEGKRAAIKQQYFLTLSTTPETVVLRIYGDKMIAAFFDRATKKVQRSFTIYKVAEDSKLVLRLETVGPLQSVTK